MPMPLLSSLRRCYDAAIFSLRFHASIITLRHYYAAVVALMPAYAIRLPFSPDAMLMLAADAASDATMACR